MNDEMHKQAAEIVTVQDQLNQKQEALRKLNHEIETLKTRREGLEKKLMERTGSNITERHFVVGANIVHVTQKSVRIVQAEVVPRG